MRSWTSSFFAGPSRRLCHPTPLTALPDLMAGLCLHPNQPSLHCSLVTLSNLMFCQFHPALSCSHTFPWALFSPWNALLDLFPPYVSSDVQDPPEVQPPPWKLPDPPKQGTQDVPFSVILPLLAQAPGKAPPPLLSLHSPAPFRTP